MFLFSEFYIYSMKRLIFIKNDLTEIPVPEIGFVTVGLDLNGELNYIDDQGSISPVGGSGGGSTNLSVGSKTSTTLDIESSNGTNTTVPSVTTSEAGLSSADDKTKLDGIEVNATSDQTDVEIKTAYENNANTNEFSDTEKTKLSNIESGATTDQTLNKTFTLQEPTSSDNITIFKTYVDITVEEVIVVNTGTLPDTTYIIKHNVDRSAAGQNLVDSTSTTSTTTGDTPQLNVTSVPAGSWMWIETSAATGTNVYLSVDIRYTED